MKLFEVDKYRFEQPELGLTQVQQILKNLEYFGFENFEEVMTMTGLSKLGKVGALNLFLAILWHFEGKPDFSDKAISERKNLLDKLNVPLKIASEASSLFLSSLTGLIESYPKFLEMIQPSNNKAKTKAPSRAGKSSSKKSSSNLPAATSLNIVSSQKRTSH